jgi:predicted amidohydrolase
MIIALASPRVAPTLDDGLERIRRLMSEASAQGAEIVCFPGAYLPGLRGQDFEVLRSVENTIYFASVNYALRFQESATSLIAPSGECQASYPMDRKAYWCRPSTSRKQAVC